MDIEEYFLYTKEHEWVNINDKDTGLIGITEYAQSSLGDITFIELPGEGDELEQFKQYASIESVKAASDIYSPMSGQVLEVNQELEENPGLINKFSYGKGWIAKIQFSDQEEQSHLMTADEYRNFLKSIG